MKTNADVILMVLSSATMLVFVLAIIGLVVIGKTIFG